MNGNGAPPFGGFSAFGGGGAGPSNWGASTSAAPAPFATTAFAPAAAAPPAAPAMTKQDSNQISTLEVLGEDSEARKKRFETTLQDNRYMQLKPLREAQRARDIAAGLIPDPLKPQRLEQATDFLGTCTSMCPEFEREEREYQNNVDPLERYPGTTRIDPARAVKAFHRPAAGNDQPLPSDVRPASVLRETLDYLFRDLMPTRPFAETHPFLRDRTRAVRQDFTMQNERGTVAIECNERIARYHVLALGVLRETGSFSESQELEQLRKVLKSLNEFYDDARLHSPPIPTPNEAEFRSYNILTHLRDPDIIWSTELLPPHVFHHPLLQLALKLHSLAQRSTTSRGERASPNAFSRFFKLVETEQVPYLFGCLLSSHFSEIRRYALDALRHAYVKQHAGLPAHTLVKMLGADDEREIKAICDAFEIATTTNEEGALLVELNKTSPLKPGTLGALKGHVSRRIVEAKRGEKPYADVIDGFVQTALPVTHVVPSSPIPAYHPEKQAASAFGGQQAPASSAFGSGGGAPSFLKAPQAVPASTPIPSLPPSRTATPVRPQSLARKPSASNLNPIASAFVPPPQSAFGLAPSANSTRAPSPFALGAATAPSFQPAANSPFGAPPQARAPPAVAEVNPFGLPSPAQTQSSPFGNFGHPAAVPPPVQPSAAFSALTTPPTFSFASPTPSNAPPIVPPVAASQPISTAAATLPPPATPVWPGPSPLSSTTPKVAPPAATRDPALVLRSRAAVRNLLGELVLAAVRPAVRRAVEAGLVHRYKLELAERKRLVGQHAAGLAESLIQDAVRAQAVQAASSAIEDRWLLAGALRVWRETLYDKLTRREEDKERRARFQAVARDIGVGADWTQQDGDATMQDDVSSVISLKRLNLGPATSAKAKKAVDKAVSERVRQARDSRKQLWTRGTFLDQLVDRVEPKLRAAQLGSSKLTWRAVVWTAKKDSAFANWLGCKFGLEERSSGVAVDSRDALVEVQLVQAAERVQHDELGLIVLDATRPRDVDPASFWASARARLEKLVAAAETDSLFTPALLVIACPEAGADGESTRATVAGNLDLPQLTSKVAKSAVWVADLQQADEQFDAQLALLLQSVHPRRERVRRPLDEFAKPLVATWRSSLREALTLTNRHGAQPAALLAPYVDALNLAIGEAKQAAVGALPALAELPAFAQSAGSTADAIVHYIQQPTVAKRGTAALLTAALAEHSPAASELTLVRLLLDQLAEWTLTATQGAQTRQNELDAALAPALKRLRERLLAIEVVPRPALGPSNGISPAKKRKASLGGIDPHEEPRSKQKLSVPSPEAPRREDKLSALSALMRDARSLLTDNRPLVSS